MANAKKKPSGENIPEAMRKTEAVKLRLSPEVATILRERAAAQGLTLSDCVSRLLEEQFGVRKGPGREFDAFTFRHRNCDWNDDRTIQRHSPRCEHKHENECP